MRFQITVQDDAIDNIIKYVRVVRNQKRKTNTNMNIKNKFRDLLVRVGLSQVDDWVDLETALACIGTADGVDDNERVLLLAVLGPYNDQVVRSIRDLGRWYFSPTMIDLLCRAVTADSNYNHVSALVSLRAEIHEGRIYTHVIRDMRWVGKKGIEEILEFLGIQR